MDPVEFRKAQEEVFRVIDSGMQKEVAKIHKAFFDAYIEAGFDANQSIELVKAWISNVRSN